MILKDSVIVITGAGRGLGAAMSERLAAQGCRLALVDLDLDSTLTTRKSCEAAGAGRVESYSANVATESDVIGVMQRISSDFGALHGLVNNAGITKDALTLKFNDGKIISEMTLDQWSGVIDANLTGTFLCGREAAKQMILLTCKGCIINISSISRHGNIGQANYSASKAGVQALVQVWAKEFSRYGIRAASVAPGFIATDMVMQMKSEARRKISASIPARRLGDPEEIAGAVQFILENEYFNGRCLDIDGALRI